MPRKKSRLRLEEQPAPGEGQPGPAVTKKGIDKLLDRIMDLQLGIDLRTGLTMAAE